VLAPVLVPGAVLAGKAPMAFLARHRAEVPAGTILVSGEEPLTAVCFLFGRDDVRILGNPGELAYGLSFPDAASRHLDPARTAELIRANPGRVALAARLRNYRRWQRDLPPPRTLDTSGPRGYVFATY
jgi:4-amino-4-deoxy-L-arabinose transferase